MYDINFETIE